MNFVKHIHVSNRSKEAQLSRSEELRTYLFQNGQKFRGFVQQIWCIVHARSLHFARLKRPQYYCVPERDKLYVDNVLHARRIEDVFQVGHRELAASRALALIGQQTGVAFSITKALAFLLMRTRRHSRVLSKIKMTSIFNRSAGRASSSRREGSVID